MQLSLIIVTITLFYLIVLCNFFGKDISCGFQRHMELSPILYHGIAIICFFFLVVNLMPGFQTANLTTLWGYTFMGYFIYLLSVKSKFYFTFVLLILLFLHENLRSYIRSIKSRKGCQCVNYNDRNCECGRITEDTDGETRKTIEKIIKWEKTIQYLALFTIIVGAIHYFYIKRKKFSKDFSILNYFLIVGDCDYDKEEDNILTNSIPLLS